MAAGSVRADRANQRIRIAHVIMNMNYGGMERMLASLIRRTDPTKFEVHLIVLQFLGRFAEGLESYATLHLAPPMGRVSMLWPHPLIEVLKGIDPDVVHAHSGVWWKSMLSARLSGTPAVVYTEHGRPSPDPWLGRLIDRTAARWTDRVVAVSDVLRHQMIDALHVEPSRLVVIPNGIELFDAVESVGPSSIRGELRIAPGAPIIGSVGRLEHIKGYDIMLEAFGRLTAERSARPRPALVVVGEGALRPALERRARELGVSGDVHWLGWRDDVARFLSEFDVFTLASRSEGTSLSLLEAMAAGLCPVVTDVGGNRAVLGDELAHRLVPPSDPAALAAAWDAALTDREVRARDATVAARRVRDAYSLESMVSAYQAIYVSLAGPSP